MSARGTVRRTTTVRRAGTTSRRGARIRRASAGLTRTRSLAMLAIILSSLALYGANASTAFTYRRLQVVGASLTPESTIRGELGLSDAANLFRLTTDGMVDRLRRLPTVADASIELVLPDTLRVRLVERQPIVVWQVGDARFLVDADRFVIATADPTTELPVIVDRRMPMNEGLALDSRNSPPPAGLARVPRIGDVLDPVDFDAATRLASLRPVDVGSGAAALHVSIDDEHGFSLDTGPTGWTAVFGFYTPTIRQTDLIPGQVRLLRGLIGGREATIATILLADDLHGVYTPKVAP
jgi:hypothetical protein